MVALLQRETMAEVPLRVCNDDANHSYHSSLPQLCNRTVSATTWRSFFEEVIFHEERPVTEWFGFFIKRSGCFQCAELDGTAINLSVNRWDQAVCSLCWILSRYFNLSWVGSNHIWMISLYIVADSTVKVLSHFELNMLLRVTCLLYRLQGFVINEIGEVVGLDVSSECWYCFWREESFGHSWELSVCLQIIFTHEFDALIIPIMKSKWLWKMILCVVCFGQHLAPYTMIVQPNTNWVATPIVALAIEARIIVLRVVFTDLSACPKGGKLLLVGACRWWFHSSDQLCFCSTSDKTCRGLCHVNHFAVVFLSVGCCLRK